MADYSGHKKDFETIRRDHILISFLLQDVKEKQEVTSAEGNKQGPH